LGISAWFQIYSENKESSASDLLITEDGGCLLVGGIGQFQESELIGGVMLIRTDAQGEIIWQEIYGGEGFEYGSSIIQSPNGGFLIVGETTSFGAAGIDGYILEVDQNGQLLWETTVGSKLNETLNSILPAPNGGYYLVGNVVDPNDFITDPGVAGYAGFAGRSNIYLTKLDSTGEHNWSQVIDSKMNMIASDAILSDDGDLFVVASVIKFPKKGDDLVLLKVNPQGELLWIKTWEEGDLGGYAISNDLDGNIVITGVTTTSNDTTTDLFVLKVDPDGNQLFFNHYGSPDTLEVGKEIIVMSDGSYVILLYKATDFYADDSSSRILAIDPNGAELWESKIDLPYSIKGATFKPHPQGGFLITGGVLSKNGELRTILVRTDSSGASE
jgi:hypothetical protein